mgnify:CR=1 FL=1
MGARAADRGGEAAIAATRREARREALRPCDAAEGGADARADARDGGADGGGGAGGARAGEARAEGAIGERFDGGDFGAARDARAGGLVRLDDEGGAEGGADGGGLRLAARGDTRGGASERSASDGSASEGSASASSDGTSSVCASSDEALLRLEERGVAALFLFAAACDVAREKQKKTQKENFKVRYGKNGLWHMGEMGLSERKTKKNSKREFQGEIWEEWALTYGRNGVE